MKTIAEVAIWYAGAEAEFGDPSEPVCQVFVRWEADLYGYVGTDVVMGWIDDALTLCLGPAFPPLPLVINTGRFRLDANGRFSVYGAELVVPGVWSIEPSLNVEGLIHAYLVLYDVPDPAPWERRIVVPSNSSREICP